MSGFAEASTILGLISAIISIIDASKKIYDAAHDTKGLPEAFREAARHLPLAENTLRSAETHAQQNNAVEDEAAAKEVLESCKEKAAHLKRIFEAVLPKADAGRLERYYKAARGLGKGGRVEDLMRGILADVQSLTNNHTIRGPTEQQLEEVKKALMGLAAIKEPSIPDEKLEEKPSIAHYGTGDIMSHSGSGPQNKFADQSKQFVATTMNFGTE